MKTRIATAVVVLGLLVGAFVAGQVVRLDRDKEKKLGLPGGGQHCCWKAGIWQTLVKPGCPNPPIYLTPSNLAANCSCAPPQLGC